MYKKGENKMLKVYDGTKFFNGKDLIEQKAKYTIVISERNNGKSFWFLQKCVCDYFNDGLQFGYVRRYKDETKNMRIDDYFTDINFLHWLKKNTGYDGIISDKGKLFFIKKKGSKKEKCEKFGNYFALQAQEDYKSLHFDEIGNVIFEEFITKEKPYLKDEFTEFMHLISTISRGRQISVYMLGNTIARDCPHLLEYGIDIFKAQQDKIININHHSNNGDVKVSFLYATPKSTANMFFGKSEKTIVGGEWETDEYPHLFCELTEVEKIYTFYMITKLRQAFKMVMFCHEKHGTFVYVYPYDYEEIPYTLGADIFTDTFSLEENYFIHPKRKRHFRIMELYKQDKFVYSTNLCGTEFTRALKKYNPFK